MDLLTLQELIHKNWYKIVRYSRLKENNKLNKITFQGICKVLRIKDENEKKIIKNNISFIPFLKILDAETGIYEFQKIKDIKSQEIKEQQEKKNIILNMYSFHKIYTEENYKKERNKIISPFSVMTKSMGVLLTLDVPISTSIFPSIIEKNKIIISKRDSRLCKHCTKYSTINERCLMREIKRKPYFPACVYILEDIGRIRMQEYKK